MDSAHSGDLLPVAAKDIGKIDGGKGRSGSALVVRFAFSPLPAIQTRSSTRLRISP
jgi:hypothetical protein